MLAGRTIVITGGAGVLGTAVGRAARDHGADVVLLDVVDKFDSDIGRGMKVDLMDTEEVERALAEVGAFHGLANIAGGFDMGPAVHETDDETWDAMFDLNVRTLRGMLRVAVPEMLKQEHAAIVNIGAYAALKGTGNMGAYTAAKSTVMRLTEALSEEVRAKGLNVNAVLPSLIDTPRNREDMPDADFDTWVKPEDLAQVICFLLSPGAKAVHGALLPVVGLS